jgi:hypothetical protein
VDVSELLSGYAKRVDRFYGWLLPELEQHLPDPVKDFRHCRDTVKRHRARLSCKLMLELWIQAKADPYIHLPKYLTSEQLAIASSLPHRSTTQVDYIISCVDRTSLCDEELRARVHQLFKVASPNGNTHPGSQTDRN